MTKKKSSPSHTARLLYASTEKSADALYFSKFFVPDAFIAFEVDKRKYGVCNMLEFTRAEKESGFDEVLALEVLQKEAKQKFKVTQAGPLEVIRLLAKQFKIKKFYVPHDFPANLAFGLMKARIQIEAIEGAFFAEREQKTDAEAEAIRKGNAASAAGIRAAERALKHSVIKNNKLYLDNKPLTSERLRMLIDSACLEVGAVASHTICAGGDQACDPHCIGSGPLRANELIIVDVFPRVTTTGYHGDMTRTFLKGKASPEQKRLVSTVRKAQELGLSKIKARVDGAKVHQAITQFFDESGYKTEKNDGVWQGFFHGTGHGLGLEVHESPRLSSGSNRLKNHAVVTVEPGLYYPGLGGCRIEDVVRVTTQGYELLSKYPYRWQIA